MDQRLDYIEQRRNGYIFINLHMEVMFMVSILYINTVESIFITSLKLKNGHFTIVEQHRMYLNLFLALIMLVLCM
ncbi:hypothetical protein HYI06_08660 [Clostridium botulinum]|uniref:hypothetical protein n=1 Tax=Clostridium botulinum TaxID=1491 RepID=UPI0006982C5D|nr:hypothetical protein [Clostridium botulinum]